MLPQPLLSIELISSWLCCVPKISILNCNDQLRNCHLTGEFETAFSPIFITLFLSTLNVIQQILL